MPTNHTPNYQLNQWEASDRVLRTDFNSDNAKIDTALGELARSVNAAASGAVRVAAGTYSGDGASSRTIYVGFTPKAVLVCEKSGSISPAENGGMAVTGGPAIYGSFTYIEIVSGGFRVSQSSIAPFMNRINGYYRYFAIG